MSIIIASASGFMVSDRRASCDGERCRPTDKVFGNDEMLAGAVGMYATVRKLRKKMPEARCPEDLIETCDEASIILCVFNGKLWEVDEDGVEEIPEKVHALGSGAHAALGYLKGAGSAEEPDCREAVKFAFTLRTDCGDGVKTIRTKR